MDVKLLIKKHFRLADLSTHWLYLRFNVYGLITVV